MSTLQLRRAHRRTTSYEWTVCGTFLRLCHNNYSGWRIVSPMHDDIDWLRRHGLNDARGTRRQLLDLLAATMAIEPVPRTETPSPVPGPRLGYVSAGHHATADGVWTARRDGGVWELRDVDYPHDPIFCPGLRDCQRVLDEHAGRLAASAAEAR